MWESLTPEVMKEYFWVIPPQVRLIEYTTKKTMKVIEVVNVVINESSNSSSEKGIKELTKEIIPLEPRVVQEILEQEPASPSTPGTPSVVEDSADITTSPDLNPMRRKDLPPRLSKIILQKILWEI